MLAVSWRDVILAVLPTAELAEGVTPDRVTKAVAHLGDLPEELTALLLETDGVRVPPDRPVVWPLDRIVRDNVSASGLLFFGDDGEGYRFAYARTGHFAGRVIAWEQATEETLPLATGLADFLTRVLVDGGEGYYKP